jgi:tRNA(fMet)-specific endonuclease VapC
VAVRLAEKNAADIVLCSVVRAELIFGALKSRDVVANLEKVRRFLSPFLSLPFDDNAADAYGRIRVELSDLGLLIGPNDLFIASIVKSHDLTLVTHNVEEFRRVQGLKIEDWEV